MSLLLALGTPSEPGPAGLLPGGARRPASPTVESPKKFAQSRLARRIKAPTLSLTTLLGAIATVNGTAEFDVDKVDLELLLGLDTDEKRRTAAGDYDLSWVVNRLEHERESALLKAAETRERTRTVVAHV